MRGFGVQVNEVPEVVVRSLRLGDFILWLWLDRVYYYY